MRRSLFSPHLRSDASPVTSAGGALVFAPGLLAAGLLAAGLLAGGCARNATTTADGSAPMFHVVSPVSAASGAGAGGNGARAGGELPRAGGELPRAEVSAAGKVIKSEGEWKKLLTAQQFHVLREKGTERAFTGEYHNDKRDAVYVCAACGLELFDSATKFDSGTGWPSFYAPIKAAHVQSDEDRAHGMVRTEVVCNRCGGHLGHVFDDGPRPTGLRYCINSVSLRAIPKANK